MAINITHNYARAFDDTFRLLDQQLSSKLRVAAEVKPVKGELVTFERIASGSGLTPTTNYFTEHSLTDFTHSRRVAFMQAYHKPYGLSDEDLAQMVVDPTSQYMQNMVAEYNREIDSVLITAALGAANEGASGGTSTAFDTTNQQITAGGTGLTLAKVRQGMRILLSNSVDINRQKVYLFTNGYGIEDMLAETGVTSIDFVDVKPNQSGSFPTPFGFEMVHVEALTNFTGASASSSSRPAILMVEGAVGLGTAIDLDLSVDRRPDMLNINQMLLKTMVGAVRIHDARVVDIRFAQ